MIILDTNVISALMQEAPDAKVVAWLDRQPRTSMWTTSVTILEVQFGIAILERGKRRLFLTQALDVFLDKIDRRIAAFDLAAAHEAGNLMALRRKKGRPVELRDTMIAGIALAQRAALATRNTVHFNDISAQVINPWNA
ncbi:MAG: type II toxin-antitoxin system VapC family toxin [Terriglobales bacterium]|jgi:predicted nucleic acid-binding protein